MLLDIILIDIWDRARSQKPEDEDMSLLADTIQVWHSFDRQLSAFLS